MLKPLQRILVRQHRSRHETAQTRMVVSNRRTAADCVDEEVVTDIADVAASTLQDEMDNDDLTWPTEQTVYD